MRFWCFWGTRGLPREYFYGNEFLHGCQHFEFQVFQTDADLIFSSRKGYQGKNIQSDLTCGPLVLLSLNWFRTDFPSQMTYPLLS